MVGGLNEESRMIRDCSRSLGLMGTGALWTGPPSWRCGIEQTTWNLELDLWNLDKHSCKNSTRGRWLGRSCWARWERSIKRGNGWLSIARTKQGFAQLACKRGRGEYFACCKVYRAIAIMFGQWPLHLLCVGCFFCFVLFCCVASVTTTLKCRMDP